MPDISLLKNHKHLSYRPASFEWLGDIPEHWRELSNKYIFRLKKSQVGKHSNKYDLLSLTLGGVIVRDMINPQGKFPAEFDTYQPVEEGDFIFCLFDVEETPRTVGLSNYGGMITGAYTVFDVSENVDAKFLEYFYLNLDKDKMLRPLYRGLRNTIPKESFASFKTALPPKSEQTAIANFLDDKTEKIERAIAIKEKQIELLKERKQILIQNAVTRGLNPDAPMKDSGVDWIGEIPMHWEVKPWKNLCKFLGGGTPSKDNLKYWQNGVIPWVSPKDMKVRYVKETQDKITIEAVRKSAVNYIPEQSMLMVVRSGILQRKIPVATNTVEVTLNQDMKAFVFNSRMKTLFSIYFILGNNEFLLAIWSKQGATVESIEHEFLATSPMVVPPVGEQEKIIEYCEEIARKIESNIDIQKQQIQHLKEYKASLINSAVTGKIKVPA